MVINAINNLQGVSLLSAPSVTTLNGLKANIDIVREFPYPTSFEKPKLSNNSNLSYSSGINANLPLVLAIPPTPREFVTQDVGVSLEVKPTTYPDQRIDLDITKAQVLDFDGFIDYGVPIVTRLQETSPAPGQPGIVITPGTINQPVFNLRSVVTDLQVLDGQTAVLGGLIREDTQEINDKVPVPGRSPALGPSFPKQGQRTDQKEPADLRDGAPRPVQRQAAVCPDPQCRTGGAALAGTGSDQSQPWRQPATVARGDAEFMIIIAKAWTPSMKRIFYLAGLLLIAARANLSAQETAAGGQAAPSGPVITNPPSGPPDTAPGQYSGHRFRP